MIQEGLAGPRGSQIHQQINTKTIRGKHRILDWFWMNLNNVYLRLVGSGASTIFPKPMNKLVVFFCSRFLFHFWASTPSQRVELHTPLAEFGIQFHSQANTRSFATSFASILQMFADYRCTRFHIFPTTFALRTGSLPQTLSETSQESWRRIDWHSEVDMLNWELWIQTWS